MVALSVSISSNTSPFSTLSPSFLSHSAIWPSVMVSLKRGIVTSAIALSFLSCNRRFLPAFAYQYLVNGFNQVIRACQGCDFQRLGVGQRHFQAAYPQHRGVQVIESVFLDGRGQFGPDSVGTPVFFQDYRPVGLFNRVDDRF